MTEKNRALCQLKASNGDALDFPLTRINRLLPAVGKGIRNTPVMAGRAHPQEKAENFSAHALFLSGEYVSLLPNWFRLVRPGKRIKRESGESPGQSRCCEAPHSTFRKTLMPLAQGSAGKVPERESVRRPAIIQARTLPGDREGGRQIINYKKRHRRHCGTQGTKPVYVRNLCTHAGQP